MKNTITKVKGKCKHKFAKKLAGWPSVLADIERDIRTLKSHRAIVRRKIEKGEPWPGDEKAGMASAVPANNQ
jgi:hypothetical protein